MNGNFDDFAAGNDDRVIIGDKLYIEQAEGYYCLDDKKLYQINGSEVYCPSDGRQGYIDENGIHMTAQPNESPVPVAETAAADSNADNNTIRVGNLIIDKDKLKKEAGKTVVKGAIGAVKLGAKGAGVIFKQAMGINPWQKN